MNSIDILEEFIKNGYSLLLCKYEGDRIKTNRKVEQAIETLIAENKELKEKIKEINEEYNAEQKHEMENTIPKSKVEGLIEELDIEIQCCTYADDDVEEYKQDIEKEKARLLRDKKMLQSLLGKE